MCQQARGDTGLHSLQHSKPHTRTSTVTLTLHTPPLRLRCYLRPYHSILSHCHSLCITLLSQALYTRCAESLNCVVLTSSHSLHSLVSLYWRYSRLRMAPHSAEVNMTPMASNRSCQPASSPPPSPQPTNPLDPRLRESNSILPPLTPLNHSAKQLKTGKHKHCHSRTMQATLGLPTDSLSHYAANATNSRRTVHSSSSNRTGSTAPRNHTATQHGRRTARHRHQPYQRWQ